MKAWYCILLVWICTVAFAAYEYQDVIFKKDVTVEGELNVDNLNFSGSTISTAETDGNINLVPDGSGAVRIHGFTPSMALQSNSSGVAVSSAITSLELSRLTGVSSNIQDQINTKAPLSSPTLTTPTIDIISLTEQGSTPATPSAGKKKLYAKNDGKVYTVNSEGLEKEIGAGGGSASFVKWITNFDGETDTSGWSWDEGGGNLAFTRTTSAGEVYAGTGSFKLSKAAEDIGEEALSYLFAIDPGISETSKKINLSIAIKTSANYTSGELVIKVVDYDNVDILPCMNDTDGAIPASPTFSIFQCSFYTVPGVKDYSLHFIVNSDNALAWDAFFELTYFSDGSVMPVPIQTNWQEYTPTSTWTTNTTTFAEWRRTGPNIQIRGYLTLSGAPDTATLTISLPPNIVGSSTIRAANSSLGADTVGYMYANDSDTSSNRLVGVLTLRDDRARLAFLASGASGATHQDRPFTWATGDELSFSAEFPVEGWDSGALLSTTEIDKKTVKLRATLSAQQNVSTTNETTIIWNSIPDSKYDGRGGLNTSTGEYTIPETGWYVIMAQHSTSALSPAGDTVNQRIRGPGGQLAINDQGGNSTSNPDAQVMWAGPLTKGDKINTSIQSNTDNDYNVQASSWLSIFGITDFSTFGGYTPFEVLTATSAEKTPSINSEYLQMTNSNLTLSAGKWRCVGGANCGNNGSAAGHSWCDVLWASENGDGTTGAPDALVVDAGSTVQPNGIDFSSNRVIVQAPTIYKYVTEPTTIYLVPRVAATTPGNVRVTSNLTCERIQ